MKVTDEGKGVHCEGKSEGIRRINIWSDGQKSDTRPKGEDETAGGHALFFVIHVAYKALHDIWLSR